jgi:large subunit ribosomal protein L35
MAKIKVKTHSGAKKRFKITKSGKIKAARPYRRHLLTKKSSNRKRHLRTALYLEKCDAVHIVPLLPYI